MSKSLSNNYKIYDLEKQTLPAGRQGLDPLALRYLYLQTHYRQEMNFTFQALEAAQQALTHLRNEIIELSKSSQLDAGCAEFETQFLEAINDDLNTPQALAVVWEMLKSDYPNYAKLTSLLKFDSVLGLDLANAGSTTNEVLLDAVPAHVRQMIEEREVFRKNKHFGQADHMRNRIKKEGFEVIDGKKGLQIKKVVS